MSKSPSLRRIQADVRELALDPSDRYYAAPLEDDMFEWHFTIRGADGTDFEGGIYHGRILLPPEYPFKPPHIVFLTPSGRFETNTKVCLSFSAYHPELWQPAWGIRLILEALISFLPTPADGAIGALDWTSEERKKLAKKSVNFVCPTCGVPVKDLLPKLKPKSSADGSNNNNASKPRFAKEIEQLVQLQTQNHQKEEEETTTKTEPSEAATEVDTTNTTDDNSSGKDIQAEETAKEKEDDKKEEEQSQSPLSSEQRTSNEEEEVADLTKAKIEKKKANSAISSTREASAAIATTTTTIATPSGDEKVERSTTTANNPPTPTATRESVTTATNNTSTSAPPPQQQQQQQQTAAAPPAAAAAAGNSTDSAIIVVLVIICFLLVRKFTALLEELQSLHNGDEL